MNEVEKMYENAGIKKLLYCDICKAQEHSLGLCAETQCDTFYPPFTAEKQLELIKWLIQKNFYDERIIRSNYEKTHFYCLYIDDYCESEEFEKFEEALANVINYFWQSLTEEERKQIKEILE